MTLPLLTRRTLIHAGAIAALAGVYAFPLAARTPVPPPLPKPAVTAAGAALERLLPALPGWTKTRTNSGRIDPSESCTYSDADAVYANGAMRVRMTLADACR